MSSLLKNAVETGNKAGFEAVLQMALDTWPEKKARILTVAETVRAEWMTQKQRSILRGIRKNAVDAETASRERGIVHYVDPALWNTQLELGASSSTGDTSEKAITIGATFNRQFGPKWEHDLEMDFDFARSDGDTTRQKFNTKYEALWKAWDGVFLINHTELELDHFSGYNYRLLETVGVGFVAIETERHRLRMEAGPGVRFSQFDLDCTPATCSAADLALDGTTDTEYLARLSTTYRLTISDDMFFRDRTALTLGGSATTISNLAEFSATLNSHLTTRLSFEVGYDSQSPVGTSAWDSAMRATLVYGF